MTWSFDTGCKYHTQDTGYYCGAAAAMMVLAEIGLPHASMNQDDLYTSNHSHNVKAGWATDPYGLRFTLVDRKPAAFTNTFVVYKPETEAEGTRKIVYTLWHYQVSPIVLVYHCMHWIVVRGVQTTSNPHRARPTRSPACGSTTRSSATTTRTPPPMCAAPAASTASRPSG